MNHSVRRDPRLAVKACDKTIRKSVPGYAAMIAIATTEPARCAPGLAPAFRHPFGIPAARPIPSRHQMLSESGIIKSQIEWNTATEIWR